MLQNIFLFEINKTKKAVKKNLISLLGFYLLRQN